MYIYTYIYKHIYIYNKHTHVCIYTCSLTDTHTFIHTSVYTHACMCTCVYADASSLPERWNSAFLGQGQTRDGGAAPAARRRVRGHALLATTRCLRGLRPCSVIAADRQRSGPSCVLACHKAERRVGVWATSAGVVRSQEYERERKRERGREKEKFIDNKIDDWRSVSTTGGMPWGSPLWSPNTWATH